MKHVVVYADPNMYAGWPANHGAWQWADELLVGFLRGPYQRKSMHNIGDPMELMQARSLDGGETWQAESVALDIPIEVSGAFERCRTLSLDPKHDIIRVRGIYDHGGDYVEEGGAFFASQSRGRMWAGPFVFEGLQELFTGAHHNTSRTCVLDEKLLFLSRAEQSCWGTDDTLCVEHKGDGVFALRGELPSGDARCVMPAAARMGARIVVCCRRRKTARDGGWIDAFGSDDEGRTWRHLAEVGVTGKNNGNPPALIADGERLVCAYANRTERQIIARESRDAGETWSLPIVLRDEGATDIGYPRLFKRADGKLVCVYYWADKERPQQHIAATLFA